MAAEKKQAGQTSRIGQDLVKTKQIEPDVDSPNTNFINKVTILNP